MTKLIAVVVALVVSVVGLTPHRADALNKPNRAQCKVIEREFLRQGASKATAARFAKIAWRESGCVVQCMEDHDDRACSRLGINFKWKGASNHWKRICGAPTPAYTKSLRTDVKCALNQQRKHGWGAWSTR